MEKLNNSDESREAFNKLEEIFVVLENSPAVQAAKLFDDYGAKTFSRSLLGIPEVGEIAANMADKHPDVSLYKALKRILKQGL